MKVHMSHTMSLRGVFLTCGWLLLIAPQSAAGNFDPPAKPFRDWQEKGHNLVETAAADSVAGECIRELVKLVSAIEVGLSFEQYSNRLVDAKVNIDQKLPRISNSQTKLSIRAALDAFIDARELRRLYIVNSPKDYLIAATSLFVKYDMSDLYSRGEWYLAQDTFSHNFSNDSFRNEYLDRPLHNIWTVAVERLQKAGKGL